MLSAREFADLWGEDRYLFPPAILEDVNIPEAAKEFLRQAGLPLRAEVPLGFYVVPLPIEPASPPVQAAKHPLLSRYRSTRFLLLAYLHYRHYRGDELYYGIKEETGHVYFMGPGRDVTHVLSDSRRSQAEREVLMRLGVPRLVNSSLSSCS